MEELRKLQAVFQTLGDFNRLSIIKSISDRECSVGEIVRSTGLSQPLVSHHLKTLKANGFLETKRDGPFIYYYIKEPKILFAIDMFLEIFRDIKVTANESFRFCSRRIFNRYKNS